MNGKELSTHVDYSTSHTPKPIELKAGQWCEITDGYTVVKVQIIKFRKVGESLQVHYRRPMKRKLWVTSWQYASQSIEKFREMLLDLGSIPSIKLEPKK